MTDNERKAYVEAWRSSQSSIAAYCRQNGLNYHTFRLWMKKFDDRSATTTESTLVKLDLPETIRPSEDSHLVIVIEIGPFSVKVSDSFNPAALKNTLVVCREAAVG